CNLVTVEKGEMRDFTAGHIRSEEGKVLIQALQQIQGGRIQIGEPLHLTAELEFRAGVSYRNLLAYRSTDPAPFTDETKTQPPHDIPDRPIVDYLPHGPGSGLLQKLMLSSRDVFYAHPVNHARQALGE